MVYISAQLGHTFSVMMLWVLCLLTLASAEQITHFKLDYGTYTVPATMTEDDSGQLITLSSSSNNARINTVVIDYNTMTAVVKNDRQPVCYVVNITPDVKRKVEAYRHFVHDSELVPGDKLYYTYEYTKPANQTPLKHKLITDLCLNYDVKYVKFISTGTTPPQHRTWCMFCNQVVNTAILAENVPDHFLSKYTQVVSQFGLSD